MDEVFHHALKLLQRRDHTEKQLVQKLEEKFGNAPPEVLEQLRSKRFLDDRRYAENFVARHSSDHPNYVREALAAAGVEQETIDRAVSAVDWPSLRDVLKARMVVWRLGAPLQRKDAARLFRALGRFGYPEDELREELERLQ